MNIKNLIKFIICSFVAGVFGFAGHIVIKQYLDISSWDYGIVIASIACYTMIFNVGIDYLNDSKR